MHKMCGNWTRHNGKPFVTPGSTDEKQDEIGIRALLEQFLSTLPESKRSMVRAAMGFDEVVHVAPKQVTLKELTAKHSQVEKRQEDMAKRIIDTQKKLESFTKQLEELSIDFARSRQSLRREQQISRFWKHRGVTPQRRQPWRSNSLHRTISRGIRRNSGLINSRKPTRQSELHKSWQHTSLPSVGVQQRLSNQNTSMSRSQTLSKALLRRHRWVRWIRLTSRISLHMLTEQQAWPMRLPRGRFVRRPHSKQRKRKYFFLVHYVNTHSFSQKLLSFIRDRSEFDLHAVVETHLPIARYDQISDQLRAVGWKLTEFTAARPSPRSAKGTTGGAAILARSHLRVDSSLDVLSCANSVEDHQPIDFAAAIVHGCHSRILLVTGYITDSQGASALNLTKLARLGALIHTMHLPYVIVGDFNMTPAQLVWTQ